MSNNRRRRPLASEREATFFLQLILSVLIATLGLGFLLARLGIHTANGLTNHKGDLLAPKRIKSIWSVFYEHLPRYVRWPLDVTLFSWGSAVFMVFYIPLFSFMVWLFEIFDINSAADPSLIPLYVQWFAVTGLASLPFPVLALWFATTRQDYQAPSFDEPTQYETIFRKGDTPLFNAEHQYTAYTIRVPRGMEWNAERITRFIEQLIYSFAPLLFRIVADEKSIVWEVVDLHGREPQYIMNAIHVIYPEAHITHKKAHDLEPITSELHRLTLVYKSANTFVHPFRRASDVTDFDPLTTLISAMNSLQKGERVSLNLFVVGAHLGAYKEGQELITQSVILPTDVMTLNGWRRIAALKASGLDRVEKYVARDQRVVEDKLRDVLYQAMFMIQVDSPTSERVIELADTVDSQTFGFAHVPYNSLHWYSGVNQPDGSRTPPNALDLMWDLTPESTPLAGSAIERIFMYAESNRHQWKRWATRLILTSQEMALFWHLPHDTFSATRVRWLSSRTVPPPPSVISELHKHLLLGYGTQGGKVFPVRLPEKVSLCGR